jgi:hypothetical protein
MTEATHDDDDVQSPPPELFNPHSHSLLPKDLTLILLPVCHLS